MTTKGIIASLTSVPLKKNYFFKKKLEFFNEFTIGKKHPDFIYDYIVCQLRLFLTSQYLSGMQLKWYKNFGNYYSDFLNRLFRYGIENEIGNRKLFEEFSNLVDEFVVIHTALEYVNGKSYEWELFPELLNYTNAPKLLPDKKSWKRIFGWYRDTIQAYVGPNPQELQSFWTTESYKYDSSEIGYMDLVPKISKRVQSLGIKFELPSKL